MKQFLKEWGVFILFFTLFLFSRFFIWQPVKVDGHSMDPTLSHGERLIILQHTKINRFDIVVAKEEENGQSKEIVKRVVGMPGDEITYKNDSLYINGKKTKEPYLKEYLAAFKEDKLEKTYSYNTLFQELAQNSNAFTTNIDGMTEFTTKIPKGEYYLLGDDRIVSRDSREVGTFKQEAIKGEVKVRFWPLPKLNLF